MDMFNKLKNAVSSALPGNPLSKDFEVYRQIGTGGPGMMWKIYSGMKRTTKQDAAVFLFEKKKIEKYSRRDKELILDVVRRGASQLTRLRHPNILSVMHPLEESRECLAFATEPVLASLANILGNHDDLPEHIVKELKEYKLYDVEIKYGILQVTEAIQFLHQDVKLLHNNICPESVIVNKTGSWKLAGFDFSIQNQNPPEQAPYYTYQEWKPDIPPCAQPNLDYMAPEYVITESCSLACDMFSQGMLIYTVFNDGKPLYRCDNQYSLYKKNIEQLSKWRGSLLEKLPGELRDIVKLLFNAEPTVRPDPSQLAKISFFEDVGSYTLQFMDTLFQQDSLTKSKYFKGLPKIIVKFPKRVNLQRILPPLLKECVSPDMIPFVLPNILQIAEQATDKEYCSLILPELIPMFKLTAPVQILLIFMQNMNLLLKKTSASDINTHVLPMVYRALESDNPQIQELSLNIVPTFADKIDYKALKVSIVPRIEKLCLSTHILEVRVKCLLCLGKLLESMDKWFVLDEVLPFLPQIPSREAAVLMSILGVYKVALTHEKLGITKDLLAGKVIPFLMTVSTEHSLSSSQFSAFIKLIREMIDKVEKDHKSKLEQLEQMKLEQKNIEITEITEIDDKTLIKGIDDKPKTMMDSFLSGYSLSGTSKSSRGNSASPSTSTPAKVTLSLEEKQRIARQQEQQRYAQAVKPTETKSSSSTAKTKPSQSSNQPKDLTSSLMQNNMREMNLSTSKHGTTVQNSTQSMGNSQSSFGSSGMGSWNSSSSGQMAPQSAKMDLSAFDNLLSNKTDTKKSMNSQMSNRPNVPAMASSSMGNSNFQGMMSNTGNQGMMGNFGNQGMMGNAGSQGMMGNFGNQSMMGNTSSTSMFGQMGNQGMMSKQSSMGANPTMSSQMGMSSYQGMGGQQNMNMGAFGLNMNQGVGMQFQQGNQSNMGQGILPPQMMGNQSSTTTSGRNEIDDLFG